MVAVKAVLMTYEYQPNKNAYHRASCDAVADISHLILARFGELQQNGHPKWRQRRSRCAATGLGSGPMRQSRPQREPRPELRRRGDRAGAGQYGKPGERRLPAADLRRRRLLRGGALDRAVGGAGIGCHSVKEAAPGPRAGRAVPSQAHVHRKHGSRRRRDLRCNRLPRRGDFYCAAGSAGIGCHSVKEAASGPALAAPTRQRRASAGSSARSAESVSVASCVGPRDASVASSTT